MLNNACLQAGGLFWLRSLSQDAADTGMRASALSLLARLAGPAAPTIRARLLHGWPTCPAAALKVTAPILVQHPARGLELTHGKICLSTTVSQTTAAAGFCTF